MKLEMTQEQDTDHRHGPKIRARRNRTARTQS
jgi:hypothetical protein